MPLYKRLNIPKKVTKQQLEELLKNRDTQVINFFENQIFSRDFIDGDYSVVEHVWSRGDKLYKLAHKYYRDKDLFWIIGLYNNKPTDSHYSYGDVVFIPINYLKFYNDVVK